MYPSDLLRSVHKQHINQTIKYEHFLDALKTNDKSYFDPIRYDLIFIIYISFLFMVPLRFYQY